MVILYFLFRCQDSFSPAKFGNHFPQQREGTKEVNKNYCLCDVTLSAYPHRAGLKNMPGHGGIRTYDLGRRFESRRGQAYFSSLPGVDMHSE